MKSSVALGSMLSIFAVVLSLTSVSIKSGAAPEKQDFTVSGSYFEGCSCMGVCPCEVTGVKMGCAGVGVFSVTSGTYNGKDLSGAKIAYATVPTKWVRLYIDAPTEESRTAAKAFGKAVLSAFGPIESTKNAKVAI